MQCLLGSGSPMPSSSGTWDVMGVIGGFTIRGSAISALSAACQSQALAPKSKGEGSYCVEYGASMGSLEGYECGKAIGKARSFAMHPPLNTGTSHRCYNQPEFGTPHIASLPPFCCRRVNSALSTKQSAAPMERLWRSKR